MASTSRSRSRSTASPSAAWIWSALLRAVLFLPEDIKLVDGGPGERRRYLDIALCQIDRTYCRTLSAFQQVLTQRNSLLKTLREQNVNPAAPAVDAQLDFWDEQAGAARRRRHGATPQLSQRTGGHRAQAPRRTERRSGATGAALSAQLQPGPPLRRRLRAAAATACSTEVPPVTLRSRRAVGDRVPAQAGQPPRPRDRSRQHALRSAPRRSALSGQRPRSAHSTAAAASSAAPRSRSSWPKCTP